MTITALERELQRPGWLRKRIGKLPGSAGEAGRLVESLDTFRRRRVRATYRRLGRGAEAWLVMREAGVIGAQLWMVREETAAAAAMANDPVRD